MTDNKYIRTHPEPDFHYFYWGAAIIFFGILLAIYSNLFIGLLIVLVGIFVLLSVKGVVIDTKNKLYKKYLNLLFIKIGSWKSLQEISHVVLKVNSSNSVYSHRGGSTTIRTDSMSVALVGEHKLFIELKEFTNYNNAKIYLYEIAEQLNLPWFDMKEEINNQAIKARETRK